MRTSAASASAWPASVFRPAATQSWYWRAGASRSLRVTGRIAGVPRECPVTTTVGPVIASKSSNRQRNA